MEALARVMEGARNVIQRAREVQRPVLATCGGFQHVVIEYACNVLGITDARHFEYDPDASNPCISPLACSLAGKKLLIDILPNTPAF